MEEGVKHDSEKVKMGLISSRFLMGLARVLTLGAGKYAAHNWRKGMATSRYYDALQRHLVAWNDGEDNDPEWGKSHLYHAACCLMFLSETLETRPDLDDRYKPDAKARDSVQTNGSPAVPQLPEAYRDLSNSADGPKGDPRLPLVHVRPLCGVGVEEYGRQAEQVAGVLPRLSQKMWGHRGNR